MQVAYYSNYFVWFEVARCELLRSVGYTYRDLEAAGVPVHEAATRAIAALAGFARSFRDRWARPAGPALVFAGQSDRAGPRYGQRSPKLKVIASNGRMRIGSSSFAAAISTHSPSRSSNASKVRSVGSTNHRCRTSSRA